MSDHLVISAIGNDQPGIINKLTTIILDQHCNIADSRMAVLGGECAIILLANGQKTQIEQLEKQLHLAQQTLGLTIACHRTQSKDPAGHSQAYTVKAVSLDHPGIIQRLAGFFSDRNINIDNLDTSSYAAAHTGTPMFQLQMHINIPTDANINTLREQFIEFCEEMNIDANLEEINNT